MIRALVLKELRETAGIAAVAVAISLVYLTGRIGVFDLLWWLPLQPYGQHSPDVPFVSEDFENILGCLSGVLGIALGFRQSAWEPSQGTMLYLLHRPIARRRIVLTKLLTGLLLQLGCTFVPLALYALWAATPGTHAGPFEWSMAANAFRIWLLMPLFYLGAFAAGLRPGQWFGSRLLPLVAVWPAAIGLTSLPPDRGIVWPLSIVVAALLLSDIFLEAATRDF